MAISNVCENYFRGFEEIFQWRSSRVQDIVLAVLKIISYLTVIIPLVVGVVYGVSSRYGRFNRQVDLLITQGIPKIEADSWGTIVLQGDDGNLKRFKDVAISPLKNGYSSQEWDWGWNVRGKKMEHSPGVGISDVEHFLFHDGVIPDVVILTQGRGLGGQLINLGPGELKVQPDVKQYCLDLGVSEVHILKTAAAIVKYDQIRVEGEQRVAALIHTTC